MLRKHPYRASFLMQWNTRMSSDNPKMLVDRVSEAILHQQGIPFEHSNEYRSIYSYDKLWQQLEHYDREYDVDKGNPYLKRGLNNAYRIFACPDAKMKLTPVDLKRGVADLIGDLNIKDKSAGLTAYGMKKFEAFTIGLDKAISILTEDKSPAPSLAGVRTQRKEKTRLVWMVPLEMTIIEALVARPLIDYFKNTEHVMTFGDYSHEVGARMRRSASNCKCHYSLDYSQFDSTIGPLFIKYAFNALRTWFDMDDEIYEGVNLGLVFDRIEKYFISTPIVMPNRGSKFPTMVVGKKGGVPSGSYFTQIVDSFVNTALIYAASARFNLGLKDSNVYVLGDDCLFFCNKYDDTLLQRISSFLSTFGFKLNPDKGSHGFATDNLEYLGRTWRNGFPIRQFKEIVRGVLYPENYRRYSDQRGVRQKQALSVLNSYLLTSYCEDLPVGAEAFSSVYHITPWMSSGFTQYLMKEGLIPGDVLKRAVY